MITSFDSAAFFTLQLSSFSPFGKKFQKTVGGGFFFDSHCIEGCLCLCSSAEKVNRFVFDKRTSKGQSIQKLAYTYSNIIQPTVHKTNCKILNEIKLSKVKLSKVENVTTLWPTCDDMHTSVAVHRFNGFSANVRPSNSRESLPTAENTASNETAVSGLNWMKSGSSLTPCHHEHLAHQYFNAEKLHIREQQNRERNR